MLSSITLYFTLLYYIMNYAGTRQLRDVVQSFGKIRYLVSSVQDRRREGVLLGKLKYKIAFWYQTS